MNRALGPRQEQILEQMRLYETGLRWTSTGVIARRIADLDTCTVLQILRKLKEKGYVERRDNQIYREPQKTYWRRKYEREVGTK